MHHQTFRSGKATTTDYDFQNPGQLAGHQHHRPVDPFRRPSQFEIFDFPGRYTQRDRGEGISSRLIGGA